MNTVLTFGKFLLPADKEVFRTWPVIACDQYTSSPEYWDNERVRIEPHEVVFTLFQV